MAYPTEHQLINPRQDFDQTWYDNASKLERLQYDYDCAMYDLQQKSKVLAYRIKRADIARMEIAELKELVRTDQCDENHTISKDFLFNKLDKIEI